MSRSPEHHQGNLNTSSQGESIDLSGRYPDDLAMERARIERAELVALLGPKSRQAINLGRSPYPNIRKRSKNIFTADGLCQVCGILIVEVSDENLLGEKPRRCRSCGDL